MRDIFSCVYRELLRRKGRTIVNVLGYVFAGGVFIVLVHLIGYSKYAMSQVLDTTGPCSKSGILSVSEIEGVTLGRISKICMELSGKCTSCLKLPLDQKGESFMADLAVTGLIPQEFVEKVKALPSVRDAVPFLLFRMKNPNDRSVFSISGFDVRNVSAFGNNYCSPQNVLKGSFLSPGKNGSVMLEEAFAISKNLEVGDKIQIAENVFPVIGIVSMGIRMGKSDVYMSFDDAKSAINKRLLAPLTDECNVMFVEAKNTQTHSQAMESVKQILPGSVTFTYDCFRPASKVLGANDGTVWFFGFLLSIGVVFLSMKSQLSSVIERRHDIGILKAIGWTNSDIVFQIIAESTTQASIGGAIGCVFGYWFLHGATATILGDSFSSVPVSLSSELFFGAFILTLIGGVIAGIFPAFHAAIKTPAEALRMI
ncbi:FtsX-like permease family protein [bacterium]|nr:FtsX-like permease family protein [bacterium]